MQNLPAFSLRKILLLSTLVFRVDYRVRPVTVEPCPLRTKYTTCFL